MKAAWSAFWTKHNPDDVFSYDTVKFVKIRDHRLGLLHYSFLIGVFIYIVGIVLLRNKEFLETEIPIGPVRLSLQNRRVPRESRPYCSDNPIINFPQRLPCVWLQPDEVIFGGTGSSLFITTKMTVTRYTRSCNITEISCNQESVGQSQEYFVGDIENYWLIIDHVPEAPTLGIEVTDELTGDLQTKPHDKWIDYGEDFSHLGPYDADELLLRKFLEAAVCNLEEPGNDYLDPPIVQTFRSFGLVIMLEIIYDNFEHYYESGNIINYKLRPYVVDKFQDFTVETVYEEYPNERIVIERNGIRVISVMSGRLGAFKFQYVLLQITTSLALLKIATILVDQIAVRLLPRKKIYKDAKFEVTDHIEEMIEQRKSAKAMSALPGQ